MPYLCASSPTALPAFLWFLSLVSFSDFLAFCGRHCRAMKVCRSGMVELPPCRAFLRGGDEDAVERVWLEAPQGRGKSRGEGWRGTRFCSGGNLLPFLRGGRQVLAFSKRLPGNAREQPAAIQ